MRAVADAKGEHGAYSVYICDYARLLAREAFEVLARQAFELRLAPIWPEHFLADELFDLGSELATPDDFFQEGMYRVGEREVKKIEELIDECQKDLEPLKSFVLPGGGIIGGYLHQCRTVCRRAEREILRLSRVEDLSEWPLKYVNRLSDLFFVLSRWISKKTGKDEYLWQRGLAEKGKK